MNDFYELLYKVYHFGRIVKPRGCVTKELLGQRLVIDKYNLFYTDHHRPFENVFSYWKNEACWYLSGDRNPCKILPHAKLWGDIKNEDGSINSNYGYRVFYRQNGKGKSLFDFALTCLQSDKESRNAIIPYNEPELCYNGNKDFICSQSQHFLIRDNKLICFIHLRSSDMLWGLYYNSIWWSLVHQQMFNHLRPLYPELKLGQIEVFISSVHVYERHWPLVEKILRSQFGCKFIKFNGTIPLNHDFEWYQENIREYFSTEEVSRESAQKNK